MNNCGECDVQEGEYHEPGCDMERCPHCKGQLISCGCCYDLLRLRDYKKNGKKYEGLTRETWKHGLNDKETEQYEQLLNKKGLIPHVEVPLLCELCGNTWPDFFMVSNQTWKKYIIPPLQDKLICRRCYEQQQTLFPHGWRTKE